MQKCKLFLFENVFLSYFKLNSKSLKCVNAFALKKYYLLFAYMLYIAVCVCVVDAAQWRYIAAMRLNAITKCSRSDLYTVCIYFIYWNFILLPSRKFCCHKMQLAFICGAYAPCLPVCERNVKLKFAKSNKNHATTFTFSQCRNAHSCVVAWVGNNITLANRVDCTYVWQELAHTRMLQLQRSDIIHPVI